MRYSPKTKVSLITLGCPKNQVDSEVIMGSLHAGGYVMTEDPKEAQVIVINTCGFIDAAKQESINTIIAYGRLKREGNCEVLLATGCLTQRYPDELQKELPELDAVIGTGDFPKIATISGQLLKKNARREAPSRWVTTPPYLYDSQSPRTRTSPKHWAYVKISEGCNYRCSFCAIPNFRGDLVSRSESDILFEVRGLAREGVREVNLIAQSLTSYGWDRKDRGALPRLLKELAAVEGIGWIRLYYTYPSDLSDEILDLMAAESKICNYVDIPLQHINDRILRAMNRKGDSRLIRRLLSEIRRRVTGVAIRSTFIVGFPDETEDEFRELCAFIEEAQFDRVGVFTYSHEDGTAAYGLKDSIPSAVKAERQSELLNLQSEISLAKNQARIGSIQTILVDGVSPESGQSEGRMEGQAPEIDGVVILEGDAQPGEFVKTEITDANDVLFFGRIRP